MSMKKSVAATGILISVSSFLSRLDYISAIETQLLASWRLAPGVAVTCVFLQAVVAEVQVLQLGVGGESPAQVLDPPLAQEVP